MVTERAATGFRVADAMVRSPKSHGPGCTLGELRTFFADDHVHMALIVAANGQLVTAVERPDLDVALPAATPAPALGTLAGRTVGPAAPLGEVTATLLRQRRRRLAVVDDSGGLLGLLCLKRDGTGYCSDAGIHARARELNRPAPPACVPGGADDAAADAVRPAGPW